MLYLAWDWIMRKALSCTVDLRAYLDALEYGRWKSVDDVIRRVLQEHGLQPSYEVALYNLKKIAAQGHADHQERPAVLSNETIIIHEFKRKWSKDKGQGPKERKPRPEVEPLPQPA